MYRMGYYSSCRDDDRYYDHSVHRPLALDFIRQVFVFCLFCTLFELGTAISTRYTVLCALSISVISGLLCCTVLSVVIVLSQYILCLALSITALGSYW